MSNHGLNYQSFRHQFKGKRVLFPVIYYYRYGLPVNFQAVLMKPQKKTVKRLREVLNQLYSHLDSSGTGQGGSAEVSHPYSELVKITVSFQVAISRIWWQI